MKHSKHTYLQSATVSACEWTRNNLFVFFLVLLTVCLPLTTATQTPQKTDIVLAYSASLITDVEPKDARAAFTTFSNELARELGMWASSIQYEELGTMIELIQKGKVDVAPLNIIDYLHYKNSTLIELGLGNVWGGKMTSRYLLFTHINRGYEKIGDLKGKKLLFLKGDNVGPLYLNAMLLRQRLGETKGFFSQIEEKSKASQVVLPVFFGQADACIINDASYKTMAEMNPQLRKNLKAFVSSSELLEYVRLFKKEMVKNIKQITIEMSKSLMNHARGRQIR
jgi:ABC-type phosphate/phosphonate transport system substrate-binding protein